MKKLLFILSILSSSIYAQNEIQSTLEPIPGLYFGGGYGWFNSVNADDKFSGDPKETQFYTLVGGIKFLENFRAEAEFIHSRTDRLNELDPASTRFSAMIFNGYAILPTPYIRPYIGAGFGYGWLNIDYVGQTVEQSGTHACNVIQGMLGVEIDIPQLPIKIMAEWKSIIATQNESDEDWNNTENEMTLHENIFLVKSIYQF